MEAETSSKLNSKVAKMVEFSSWGSAACDQRKAILFARMAAVHYIGDMIQQSKLVESVVWACDQLPLPSHFFSTTFRESDT